jgi:heat shock protein HtpX
MWNSLKTTLLLASLTGLLVLLGGAVGGQQGMVLMLVMSAVMNLGTWWFSDSIVLRTSGAVPITDPRLRWLDEDVAELARAAGMPKPRVFIVPNEPSPNAFATGRDPEHGVVAVTAGLLHALDRREIRGVLAHELGHIANRDTLVSAVAATVAGTITFLARLAMWTGDRDRDTNPLAVLALAVLAPVAALVLRMMVSRTREYGADERAAELTGDPEGLALALEGLASGARRAPMHSGGEATHYIVQRFTGGLGQLFSTHPPIEERVRRLRALGGRGAARR